MQIIEIYYEKVFPIAPYVNEKIGVKITVEEGENPKDVWLLARAYVHEWGHKLGEERPQATTFEQKEYYGVRAVDSPPYGTGDPVAVELEFQELKQQLANIEYREDAQQFLNTTSFKFSIEAKKLVEQKPLKNG